MKRIEGRAKTVRELMDRSKFAIDFYQREYAWKERQVRELIHDLTNKFLDFYRPDHKRSRVKDYGHYFLGSVVISHKDGRRYIVDGQQRITTLTLLLIHLHHLQADRPSRVDVRSLVFSEEYGDKSFNLDVPDRNAVMRSLLEGAEVNLQSQSESVVNIGERYAFLEGQFPEDVAGDALPFFVDWLLNHVHIVEIEAYNDEDAYSIFETMNDRGLSLSLPEMLKGYVLSSVSNLGDQKQINTLWKRLTQDLKDLGKDEDVDFFKNWLRSRYAVSFQTKGQQERSKDYERIGAEFHRWVRDHRKAIGLHDSPDFVRWVTRDLDFYARQTLRIRRAALAWTPELPAVRYNEERAFTQQTQLLLAPLEPTDPAAVIDAKLRLVSDFLDIWLSRRVWCGRTIAQRNTKNEVFQLTKQIRGATVERLSEVLRAKLDAQAERFAARPDFGLNKQNYRLVRHTLARLTHWVDEQCGVPSHFDDLVSAGRGRPFEVEHIWANHWDRFADDFAHPAEFDLARNRIGGLLMLQQGLNQSLGDATYAAKRAAYLANSQNLLARSLHPSTYDNNPAFNAFVGRTGLAFRAYDDFGHQAQQDRQELFIRIAEWVWNPSRLKLDGEAPPVHEPIGVVPSAPAKSAESTGTEAPRFAGRRAFWTELLAHAAPRTSFHSNCNPSGEQALVGGSGRNSLTFNYVVLQDSTRAELYICTSSKDQNKAYFDQLAAQRADVEAEVAQPMDWRRLDDNKTCRICVHIDKGGWGDPSSWEVAIPATVDAMIALRTALQPRVATLEAL